MLVKMIKNTGSYKKDSIYEINKRMAVVLIHAKKAVLTSQNELEQKAIIESPENKMLIAQKPVAARGRPRKNNYEIK